jgi:hypothetical protein
MTEPAARTPNSDIEAAGLPDYADDDSSAYDEFESVREADGPQPAPLPPDREDGPLALDEFGVTMGEEASGESLDGRLAREEPDVAIAGDETLTTRERQLVDEPPVEPDLDSPVSLYDHDPSGAAVGRLVEPDGGGGEDVEPDAVANDAGPAGGGATAEEDAVHTIDEDELSPGRPGDGYV